MARLGFWCKHPQRFSGLQHRRKAILSAVAAAVESSCEKTDFAIPAIDVLRDEDLSWLVAGNHDIVDFSGSSGPWALRSRLFARDAKSGERTVEYITGADIPLDSTAPALPLSHKEMDSFIRGVI